MEAVAAGLILFGAYINATWQRRRERQATQRRIRSAQANDEIVTAEELSGP